MINHFKEFVNKKNATVALTNFTEDFIDHDEAGGIAIGPVAAMKMMEAVHKSMSDIHVSIEDVIAEDDKVMVRNTWTGTTQDSKKIHFKGFVLWRLKDGKIAERWATLTAPYLRKAVHGE